MIENLLEALFPWKCAACGAAAERPPFCAGCTRELEPLDSETCPRCALPLPPERGEAEACLSCLLRPPLFDRLRAAYAYGGSLREAILRTKHSRKHEFGTRLGDLMAARLGRFAPSGPALVCPVPLHPRHHRARGFNQAALLARTLAARLGLVFDDSVLHRHRVTGSQRGLDAARRAANVAGAFAARAPPEGGFQAVVLLVDDVVASGATVSECARALKRAGWDRVEAWCLARSV